jgi:hypothetical protein
MGELNELGKIALEIARSKGFMKKRNEDPARQIALMHSELSEREQRAIKLLNTGEALGRSMFDMIPMSLRSLAGVGNPLSQFSNVVTVLWSLMIKS